MYIGTRIKSYLLYILTLRVLIGTESRKYYLLNKRSTLEKLKDKLLGMLITTL